MDVSVVSGSEAVFDHVCQPCSDDEKIREAVGFCVDCAEWLCDECFRIHKRARPARHHVLRDLKEMKKSTSHVKPTGKCTEKCDQHSGKRLKYYCPVHDFLGCSLCVIQGHGTCKVDHIPDVCETSDINDEFKTVTDKLEAVARESIDTRKEVTEKKELLKTNTEETEEAVQCHINKLKESLDDVGAALVETCKQHAKEETTKLNNVTRECEYIEKESFRMKTHLENLQSTGQHCNAFVALKQSKGNLATLEMKQKDVKRSSPVTTYTFKPNMAVEATITGSEGIGTLIEQHSMKDRDYSNIQTQHVTNILVKSSGNDTCNITGSTLLSPDKLVLADHWNDQVKVVDTKTNTMISEYKNDGYVFGICKASDTSVVVTDYNKRRLLFLAVNAKGNISLLKTLLVNGECKGVAVVDDKMMVTYDDPSKVEIMDTRGTVLKTVTDPQVVNSPEHVTVNPDRQSVYISNRGNNTVNCVKLDGTLLATYKDNALSGPEQIAIDSNGMVYVGCNYSKNVHLLTPDCKKVKVILDESDGLGNVCALSYCEHTNRLYIGMTNVIKVFKLS